MNFHYRLMQFMSGRYGRDELLYALLILAAVLSFLNILIRSIILQLLVYALIFYAVFRVLSRNAEARRRENEWFRQKLTFFYRKREVFRQRRADQAHVYKPCPSCKAVLRLPRRIGVHQTVCPKCGRKFTVRVRK